MGDITWLHRRNEGIHSPEEVKATEYDFIEWETLEPLLGQVFYALRAGKLLAQASELREFAEKMREGKEDVELRVYGDAANGNVCFIRKPTLSERDSMHESGIEPPF